MDRLFSMTVFVKAVELGSFSAAADALQMSPQLVGKNVRMLEQHLGVRLLNRTTRSQHLTEIGATFYERARNILAEMEIAEGLAAQTRIVPRGKLRINASVTFGVHALTAKIAEYMQLYPEISVELCLSNRYIDLIDEGFDAIFRIGELSDSGLIARQLRPYRLILCASPRYLETHESLLTPDDLTRHECLGFSHTELRTIWTFDGPDGHKTVQVKGRLMSDSGEAIVCAGLCGAGIMLQPSELVTPYLQSGQLVEILPEYKAPTRPMHLVHTPDRRMTPKLRSFVDFIVASFGINQTEQA
ncbi:LysR family transcriptional regulator [Tolumonas auensis]|uniref:LysR family transcriptional regulator n=1 Tax=Tolumonas auensis TaxID=43948 RepID=UPI002AA818DD|nr:LysR family transcriptional regulator [Tolumonas auensis]